MSLAENRRVEVLQALRNPMMKKRTGPDWGGWKRCISLLVIGNDARFVCRISDIG